MLIHKARTADATSCATDAANTTARTADSADATTGTADARG
jgi:hypothetical protein